jgi:hypothetical protein
MAIKEETITNMSPHRRPKKIKKIPVLEANEKVLSSLRERETKKNIKNHD